MNDPCAPGFDTTTQTYHLFYQWNPLSSDWGNISWGHYMSRDGLRWHHNGDEPVLQPSAPYDKDGVFTGCLHPTGPRGEHGQLTVIYTSVTNLPIHWTLPYVRNCEGLAIATSADGGRTWHKSSLNPIMRGEPEDITVTGFRDPYLARWPAMDRVRGCKKKNLYGMISGGVRDKGPTTFLYAVSPSDLTRWEYIGTLGGGDAMGIGFRPSPRWAGDFGVNWECVNFMTLADKHHEFQFLTVGSEGGIPWGHDNGACSTSGTSSTEVAADDTQPQTLWLAGSLAGTAEAPKLNYRFSGILDHGCLYAPGTYEHPVTHQRVAWGWLKEDDLTLERRTAKGWTGHLSLQRELFLYSKNNVVRGLASPLRDIHSIHCEENAGGGGGTATTIRTLGIRPLPCLKSLRRHKLVSWPPCDGALAHGHRVHEQGHLANMTSHWEMEAIIKISSNHGTIGFIVSQNANASLGAKIFFDLDKEVITVDRSLSNREPDIKKDAVSGPFTLFVCEKESAGAPKQHEVEDLHLRIFRDGDVLEVFANDRFALSTMVYSDPSCRGLSWFVEGEGSDRNTIAHVDVWELDSALEDDHPKTKI
jgi:beta-fructofuranosidase